MSSNLNGCWLSTILNGQNAPAPSQLNVSLSCQCLAFWLAYDSLQRSLWHLLAKGCLFSAMIGEGKHLPMQKQVWPLCLASIPRVSLPLGTTLISLPCTYILLFQFLSGNKPLILPPEGRNYVLCLLTKLRV